jgi:hypothetical protein
LSIVVYTIIAIEMMVYATLNLCKIGFWFGFQFFFEGGGGKEKYKEKKLQFLLQFIFAFFHHSQFFSVNTGIGFFHLFSLKTN